MQNDLADGVKWAVEQGIADPRRVGYLRRSNGGYARSRAPRLRPTFIDARSTMRPVESVHAAGVVPAILEVARSIFFTRVGESQRPKDKELLTAASPPFSADKIKIPMLIGQGANDPRVKQAEAEQIVDAIAKHRGSAVYVLFLMKATVPCGPKTGSTSRREWKSSSPTTWAVATNQRTADRSACSTPG